MNEINRLAQENKELSAQVDDFKNRLESKSKTTDDKASFDELIEILKQTEIETKAFNKPEEKEPKKVDLFKLFYAVRDDIVTGITNAHDSTDYDTFLYYNVCPKLQVHDLVANEKVAGVRWRRFAITKRGQNFLAHVEKLKVVQKTKPKAPDKV
ncbi:MAG: hypothetical protein ABSH15_01325 [Verrucomicrobiota bacterium]